MATRFEVRRDDIRQSRWATAQTDMGTGAVRTRIDLFALTANNITYATLGDTLGYWQHFPTDDPETGCVPAWGFGSVTESDCHGVDVGDRFYGYFPIADEVVLYPDNVANAGFIDSAEHRRGLPSVYAQYERCTSDASYVVGREPQQALLRPLFTTSFLLDDFLHDNEYFGADTVVLAGASSKTAYGTAFCLSQRQGADSVRVVGLTSPANKEFTQSLGCYHEVLTYDQIDTLLPDTPSAVVDFSGNSGIRSALHRRLGDRLTYDCAVGLTHWNAESDDAEIPGPSPVLFFAPDQAAKRAQDWGTVGLRERMAIAWAAFMEPVTRTENPWLTVVTGQGQSAVESCYTALLDGQVPAREGHVLSV